MTFSRLKTLGLLAAPACLWLSGCSQSTKTTAVEEKTPEAVKTAKTVETPQKNKYVYEIVDSKRLQEFLPESIPDLPRKEFKGESTNADGNKISRAWATYGEGAKRVELEIIDFMEAKQKKELVYWWLSNDVDHPNMQNGYEKTGYCQKWYKAYEIYDKKENTNKYQVYAGLRYIVSGVAFGGVEMDVVKKAVESIDFKKLAALK